MTACNVYLFCPAISSSLRGPAKTSVGFHLGRIGRRNSHSIIGPPISAVSPIVRPHGSNKVRQCVGQHQEVVAGQMNSIATSGSPLGAASVAPERPDRRQPQPSPSSRLGQPSGRLRGGSGQRLISSALRWK